MEKVNCKNCNKEELVFLSRAKNYTYCSKDCMSKSFTKTKINKNEKINNWLILDDKPIRKYGRSYIKVECTCGSCIRAELPISNSITKQSKGCRECSRHYKTKGYRLISLTYWSQIQNGAKIRNLEFDISIEYAWELFELQNKKCALSNLDIKFESNQMHSKEFDNRLLKTASFDRIDSSKGYIKGNVQWIHKDINLMKNKFDESYFKKICKLITENDNKDKTYTS